MLVGLELVELARESERLISSISLNSSTATAVVSIGAVSLLLVSTALYLYNYYNKPSYSDGVPQYNPYGTYDPNYRYKRQNLLPFGLCNSSFIPWSYEVNQILFHFPYVSLMLCFTACLIPYKPLKTCLCIISRNYTEPGRRFRPLLHLPRWRPAAILSYFWV